MIFESSGKSKELRLEKINYQSENKIDTKKQNSGNQPEFQSSIKKRTVYTVVALNIVYVFSFGDQNTNKFLETKWISENITNDYPKYVFKILLLEVCFNLRIAFSLI